MVETMPLRVANSVSMRFFAFKIHIIQFGPVYGV